MVSPFDFDHWANLATTDPVKFYEQRKDAIEALILSAPARVQPQLRELQHQIDLVRATTLNPLDCTKIMMEMLATRLTRLHGATSEFHKRVTQLLDPSSVDPQD